MSYLLPSRLTVVAQAGGVLERFWAEHSAGPYAVQELPTSLSSIAAGASAEAAVREAFAQAEGVVLLLTDLEDAQRLAVQLKLRRRQPSIVMRWWDRPANLKPTYRDRLVFNRYTGVNFMTSRADLEANVRPPKGGLVVDNPVLLDQPAALGEDSWHKTMRHTLLALTQPTRTDVFGHHKRNHGAIKLTLATHFYCNQDNIDTVTSWLRDFTVLPAEVLDQIQFVIVDDGSPLKYDIPDFDLNLTWVRIDQDIRWNQAGARNAAMLHARAENVVITDVDHAFPEHTVRWLLDHPIKRRRFYKFWRKMPDGSLIKGHPNIFYMARSRFFQLFGTDEEFAGAYGAEDYRFVKNFKNHGTVQSHLPKDVFCIERQLDREKSYHSLVRDLSFNTGVDTRKRLEIDHFGASYGHSRHNYNFTQTVLLDRMRTPTRMPPLDRGWRQRWWLRQFASLLCSR